MTPVGKILLMDAVPTENLPLQTQNPREKVVQVAPEFGRAWIQTIRNLRSDNVVQAGPSFTTQERHNRKLTTELEKYQNHLKMIESGEVSYQMDLFHKSCDKFLSPQLSELIKAQTKKLMNDTDKANFLPCMAFCFNLYHASPRAYRYLKDDLQLPSITTLKGMVFSISTKVTDVTMAPLKSKFSNMVDIEKYCSVMVDVMPLKSFLSYNRKEDKIAGFVEIDGEQVHKPARRAIVIVARGILVDWIQPVGFSLISDTDTSPDISRWIDKILMKLFDCGLEVKTFVCTSSKYLNEREIRSVTVNNPFFFLNGVRICYMLDTPYLLRQLRNTFLTHNMSYQDDDSHYIARFRDVKKFYELDKTRRLKLAPKLTDAHIDPTQSEKSETIYATQLLSRSVAAGLSSYIDLKMINSDLPYNTADFVLLINNLFDLLNASTPKMAFCGEKEQMRLLKKSLHCFESLKLINSRTGVEMTTTPSFVEEFHITIKALLYLYKEIDQHEWEKIITRRLNLEATKSLITKLKPRGKIIPVSQRFLQRFRKLYLSYILRPLKKGTASENLGEFLSRLNELSNDFGETDQISEALEHCEQDSSVQMLFRMAENHDERMTYHFCGFLLKKCAEHHKDCRILRTYVDEFESMYGLEEKTNSVRAEQISSEAFIAYVVRMENQCRETFESIMTDCHIGSQMFNACSSQMALFACSLPCPCFPVQFLQKLFIRLRIRMLIHSNNSVYRMQRYKGKKFSFPSL